MEEKNPVGRPSKLTRELVDKANFYMLSEFQNQGDAVPSHAGLCCYLGIVKSTLYEFAKLKCDLGIKFSNTLDAIKVKQEKMLLSGGLLSTYNAPITKLMLTNHGYSDKQEVDLSSHDGTMTPSPAVVISGKEVKEVLSKLNDEC